MSDAVAKLPADLEGSNARTTEGVIGAAVSSMSGGDNRLSRAGPVGVKVGRTGSGRLNVDPRGPVHLVENPTAPHVIGSSSTRLRIGSSWITGPAFHRGTKGKGEWVKARGELVEPVRAETAKAMHTAAQGAFG